MMEQLYTIICIDKKFRFRKEDIIKKHNENTLYWHHFIHLNIETFYLPFVSKFVKLLTSLIKDGIIYYKYIDTDDINDKENIFLYDHINKYDKMQIIELINYISYNNNNMKELVDKIKDDIIYNKYGISVSTTYFDINKQCCYMTFQDGYERRKKFITILSDKIQKLNIFENSTQLYFFISHFELSFKYNYNKKSFGDVFICRNKKLQNETDCCHNFGICCDKCKILEKHSLSTEIEETFRIFDELYS